jgi:exonuclease SbcD
VLAHGWVHGGQPSESERDISVGGVGGVPAALFDGFAYGALGHLHRPQEVGERLRYSGSALPYSFSEAGQEKGSWLVDLQPELDQPGVISFVPTPAFRALTSIRGELDALLTSRAYAPHEGDFLAITLTDPTRPVSAMERLRQRFPHVLTLNWEPAGAEAAAATSYRDRLRGRSDLDIALDFVAHVRGVEAQPAERALLDDALVASRREDDAA